MMMVMPPVQHQSPYLILYVRDIVNVNIISVASLYSV